MIFHQNQLNSIIRKIIDICHNLLKQFNFILVAVTTPFESIRNEWLYRSKLGESYYEIFVKSDLKTLISRDTKGLYQNQQFKW